MPKPTNTCTYIFSDSSGKHLVTDEYKIYPVIVQNKGTLGSGKKSVQVEAAWLCDVDSLVLAEWNSKEINYQVNLVPFTQGILGAAQPGSILTTGQNLRVDKPKHTRRTKAEMEAESAPAPAEDPIERVKRQGREAKKKNDDAEQSLHSNINFPPVEPWVDDGDDDL